MVPLYDRDGLPCSRKLKSLADHLLFFKVENNSLELTRIFRIIFIDPIVSVRKKAEKRDRHEEREKERKRRFGVNAIISQSLPFFLSLFMSISLLRLFSRAHSWVNKYILIICCI